jgi:hypothetical protein
MKVIVTVDEFQKLNSSEIVKIMDKRKSYAIIGDMLGVDRQIIDRNHKDVIKDKK